MKNLRNCGRSGALVALQASVVALAGAVVWCYPCLVVAQDADQPVGVPGPTTTAMGQGGGLQLQQVVITAEKRSSTVQETPMSITALSGDQLAAQGVTDMLSVAQETPGVSLRSAGPGQTEFEMRGLSSSGGATATVGYYLDDVPISPPALGDIGKVVIDPNLYDLSRVEVLRGPQGTLYGAGSMGGTIRLITHPPVLNKFAAATDDSVGYTHSGGTDWSANLLANFPLIRDVAAARLVLSSEDTAGWIDRTVVNPFPMPTNTGCTPTIYLGCARGDVSAGPVQKVVPRTNWSRLDNARLEVLVQPSDALSIEGIAMYEQIRSGGYNAFDAPPGPGGRLAHYQPFDTPEPMHDSVKLAGIKLNYNFAHAALTVSPSYWTRTLTQFQEISEEFQNLYYLPAFLPNEGTYEEDDVKQSSVEARLTSIGNARFQWLVGAYYSDLRTHWDQTSIDPALTSTVYATGLYLPVTAADNPQGLIYVATIPYNMRQYAVFSEDSYRIGPSLKLTVGARFFKYDSQVHASQAGLFTQSVSAAPTLVDSNASATGFSPKATLSYIPNRELTLYGTIARGFRPGGVNLPLPAAGPNSCTGSLQAIGVNSATGTYGADTVTSYEVGEKASLDQSRMMLNTSLYYINWYNMQLAVPLPCGYFFNVNAGQARSYGSEVEFRANVTQRLSLDLGGGYTNAQINSPRAGLGIAPGTPMLNIPKYTGSASVQYVEPLGDQLSLSARLGGTYTSSITDEAYTYVRLPSYALLDARLGLVADRWSLYLSGMNLTNKVAELTANNTSLTFNTPDITRITMSQPRTISLEASTTF